jgi:hypothetical protein
MTPRQKALVAEAVHHHNPEFIDVVDTLGTHKLTDQERERLREAIAAELCATALEAQDEPNQRGVVLEALIDLLGYMYLMRVLVVGRGFSATRSSSIHPCYTGRERYGRKRR